MTEDRTRVLVVDDEFNIAELVSLGLRYEGFDVSSAQDGRGALRAVRQFRPELMILDVTMPDIDGLEVVRRMRRAEHLDAGDVSHRSGCDRGQDRGVYGRR
jgi:two-component system, OmpR family, response regulator